MHVLCEPLDLRGVVPDFIGYVVLNLNCQLERGFNRRVEDVLRAEVMLLHINIDVRISFLQKFL